MEKVANLSERLAEAIKEYSSTTKVAEQIGMSKQAISAYTTGVRVPKRPVINALAEVLGISPLWLMGYDVSKFSDSVIPALPSGAEAYNPQRTAPLLGTVRAGLPMYAEENIEGYIPIMQEDGSKYFWLRVRGDSMNAIGIADGDQILVREQPEVENGQLAVVLVNGDEATVKYFRREGNIIILTPKSFNPEHQPQVYDLKSTPIRVIGLVIECRKVF